MKLPWLGVAFLLGGCATLFPPDWSVYRTSRINPLKPEDNPIQFNLDKQFCQLVAENWYATFSVSTLLTDTGNGGLGNTASLDPYGILAGAAGGAANSVLAQSGLSRKEERDMYLDCLQRRTDDDKSGFVPHQR